METRRLFRFLIQENELRSQKFNNNSLLNSEIIQRLLHSPRRHCDIPSAILVRGYVLWYFDTSTISNFALVTVSIDIDEFDDDEDKIIIKSGSSITVVNTIIYNKNCEIQPQQFQDQEKNNLNENTALARSLTFNNYSRLKHPKSRPLSEVIQYSDTTTDNHYDDVDNDFVMIDEVEADDEYFSEFMRWLNQNDASKKIFLYPGTIKEFSYPSSLNAHFTYLTKVSSIPITTGMRVYVNAINYFSSGMNDVLNGIWPVVYYPLQAFDFLRFQISPNLRFNSNLTEWTFGTAKNTHVITSYWASDIVTDPYYYSWPASVIGITAFLALWRMLKTIGYNREVNVSDLIDRLNNHNQHWFYDSIQWFNPLPIGFQSDLDRAIYSLEWDGRVNENDKIRLLKALKHIASESESVLTQTKIVYALGEIANTYRAANARLIKGYYENQTWKEIEKQTLNKLRKFTKFTSDGQYALRYGIRAIYANHVLWQHGYLVNRTLKWLFLMKTTIILTLLWYSKARLVEMLWQKTAGIIDFYDQKKECETRGLQWEYVEEWAQYVCAACPDWEDIYLGDITTNQGCVNGILSKERSPEEILQKISRVLHSDVTKIDFTRQNISRWTERQWENFLKIISASVSDLDIFNLSREILSSPWPSAAKLKTFANFINQVHIAQIDLHNQNIGPDSADTFLENLQPPLPTRLDLSNNAIGDAGARKIIQILSHPSLKLQELILNGNQISDDVSAQIVAAASNHPSLVVLDLGNNACGQKTIDVISTTILHHPFRSINLSGNSLSDVDMMPLWCSLANSTQIEALYLDKTTLLNDQLADAAPYLPQWSLKCFSVANNGLTVESVDYLFQGLKNNTAIQELHLSRNPISDEGLEVITEAMSNMAVKALYLDECNFSSVGMKAFFSRLKEARYLQTLTIARNTLNDDVMITLSESMANSSLPLQYLDASSNRIGDIGGSALASKLPQSNIRTIILTDNELSDRAALVFAETLPHSNVHTLIVNQNFIGPSGVKALGNVLSQTLLENIGLGSNPVGDGLPFFVQQLVKPIPQLSRDDARKISVDERRRLYEESEPNTKLKKIDIDNTGMENDAAILACRILPLSQVSIADFKATENTAVTEVDMQDCRITSESSRLSPHATYAWLLSRWRSDNEDNQKDNYQWLEADENIVIALRDEAKTDNREVYFLERE